MRAAVRRDLNLFARALRRLFFRNLPEDTRFAAVPTPRGDDVADIAARSTWYLGSWSRAEGSPAPAAVPCYLDQDIDISAAEVPLAGGPVHHLVWKVTVMTYIKALTRPSRYTFVDPAFAKDTDTEGFLEIPRRMGRAIPTEFLTPSLTADTTPPEHASALILGTGPSAGDLVGDHTRWTYRIVCNSAIRNEELMERLRPTHIAFGDPVFHFGPSAYAGQFRKDLQLVAERYDSILVVPGYCAEVLAANMPWARGRMLPLELRGKHWHVPTMDELWVRRTGNVMTQQMLPLAVSIATSIDIGGADGRKSEEKYFWTHSKANQYDDALMNTVFETHPAFFRDADYADYYAEHCAAVEELVAYGEARGRTFRTVTSSYIPGLAARLSLPG